jgi:hypothetical protein
MTWGGIPNMQRDGVCSEIDAQSEGHIMKLGDVSQFLAATELGVE